MSAGTRSGVNCTRWNCAPMALARDLTASVLARPGTPSTRMCPRDSSAMSSRSRSTSCPTMVFLTSYRTCSIGFASNGYLLLLGRPVTAAGGDGRADGYGEAHADERARRRRVGQRHHDADRLALAVDQRSSRAAGVHGGVELD